MEPNKEQPKLKSSAPAFRSVMMAPAIPQQPLFSAAGSSVPFTKTTPAAYVDKRSNVKVSPPSLEGKEVVSGWNSPKLARISSFYPLERSHRRFPKGKLSTVLERLTGVFQRLSFETTFINDDPTAQATCRSLEGVEFSVSLWEAHSKKDQAILEIQRVAGDSVAFHEYTNKIFGAVFIGKKKKPTMTAFSPPPALQFRPVPPVPPMAAFKKEEESPLELALDQLLSDRQDSRSLGLETLAVLTDRAKTDYAVAQAIAKAVLLGHFENVNSLELRTMQDHVFHLALLGRWPDANDNAVEEEKDEEKSHAHLALMIIANAMSLLKDGGDDSSNSIDVILQTAERTTGGRSMILTLQEYVTKAKKRPHTAYLATRILTGLCSNGNKPSCHAHQQGLQDAVRAAQCVGQCSHAALESETRRFLTMDHQGPW